MNTYISDEEMESEGEEEYLTNENEWKYDDEREKPK